MGKGSGLEQRLTDEVSKFPGCYYYPAAPQNKPAGGRAQALQETAANAVDADKRLML